MKRNKTKLSDITALGLTHMVHDIFSSFLAPILPLLITKFSLSYSQAGFLSIIQRMPSVINPVVGFIADKINPLWFIILTPSVTAVCMSLLGSAGSYTVLAILLFTMGTSATFFHVPAPVIVKGISGTKPGLGMSIYMAGGEIARTLGPLTILGAVSLWGLESTYKLIPFGISASILLYFKVGRTVRSYSAKKTVNKDSITLKELLKETLKSKRLWIIISGITLCRSFLKAALTTFLPTFLTDTGSTVWSAGISLAIVQLAGAAGTFIIGSFSDKVGRKPLLLMIGFISPLMLIGFLFSSGSFKMFFLITEGFFLTAVTPLVLAMVQDVKSERPAFFNSIYMTISFLLPPVSTVSVGITGDIFSLNTSFLIAAFAGFGVIPFVCMIREKKQ